MQKLAVENTPVGPSQLGTGMIDYDAVKELQRQLKEQQD